MTADILWIIILLFVSALFSAMEIAFVSANKLKIELKKRQGDAAGLRLSKLVKSGPRVITTILICNNIGLVLYGMFVERVLDPPIMGWLGMSEDNAASMADNYLLLLLIQSGISTVIILVFGEYLPKALSRLNPDGILSSTSWILNFVYRLFSPFVSVMDWLSGFFLNTLLKLKSEEEDVVFGKKELNLYMQETLQEDAGESRPEIDAEMFNNALEFNTIKAREFMIPRTEIRAVPIDTTPDELMEVFIETQLSKIIVYGKDLDQVVGYVHSSAMFRKPKSIQEVVQPLLIIPESMPGNVLLSEFTRNRRTVAIVVDEFGGTAGLVTVEDLVEEVFGEIEDEHDKPEEEELLEKKVDDRTWLFSARLEVYYVNDEYNLRLPEGEYNTLAGLVMYYTEDIAGANENFIVGPYRITVLEASATRIQSVKVELLSQEEE